MFGFASSLPEDKALVLLLHVGFHDAVHDLFRTSLGPRVEMEVVRVASQGEWPSKELHNYDGILVSGSSAMVTDRHDWSTRLSDELRPIVLEGKVPVLAICFGHQLISEFMGGTVDYIERRQLGVTECSFHADAIKDDPLFNVFSGRESAKFFVAHRQCVTVRPPNSVLLASCPCDPHYAFRFGPRAWTVQFHPEMRATVIQTILKNNREGVLNDGLDPEEVFANAQETKDGIEILSRFSEICHDYFSTKKEDFQNAVRSAETAAADVFAGVAAAVKKVWSGVGALGAVTHVATTAAVRSKL